MQPDVMPSVRIASMCPANSEPATTSVNAVEFVGGIQFDARIVALEERRHRAARHGASGQYWPALQPVRDLGLREELDVAVERVVRRHVGEPLRDRVQPRTFAR